MKYLIAAASLLTISFSPVQAFAGDGATLIFESGLVVELKNDGFKRLVEEMKKLNSHKGENLIAELNIGRNTYIINVAELVLVCRDNCSGLEIKHQLAPRRG